MSTLVDVDVNDIGVNFGVVVVVDIDVDDANDVAYVDLNVDFDVDFDVFDDVDIKVFKHTFDVLEDYICQGLIAIGAIGLSVRYSVLQPARLYCVSTLGFVKMGLLSVHSLYNNYLFIPLYTIS